MFVLVWFFFVALSPLRAAEPVPPPSS